MEIFQCPLERSIAFLMSLVKMHGISLGGSSHSANMDSSFSARSRGLYIGVGIMDYLAAVS